MTPANHEEHYAADADAPHVTAASAFPASDADALWRVLTTRRDHRHFHPTPVPREPGPLGSPSGDRPPLTVPPPGYSVVRRRFNSRSGSDA